MRYPVSLLGAAAIAVALMAGGCGGSSSSTTAASSSTASTQESSTASSTTAAATPNAGTATVVTTKKDKLGTVLAAGKKKLTVYLWEADKGSTSVCSGACAKVWPPVATADAAKAAGAANPADLGMITRPDGSTQVTYKGHPLYYYIKDKDDGDAYGQGSNSFGAAWYVLNPSGNKIDSDGGGGGNS